MNPTVKSELGRAAEYIDATLDATLGDLPEKIASVIAEGLSYNLVVLKDGAEVQEVPVALAAAIATVSLLPPARLMAMGGLAFANLKGYTFRVQKKQAEPPK